MLTSGRIINPVCKVNWAGWESDTLRLQERGWQISMEQEIHRHAIRMCIKHPDYRMYGITRAMDYSFMSDMSSRPNAYSGITFPIEYMASRMDVITLGDVDFNRFSPVDAVPQFITDDRKSIEDFNLFRPMQRTQEILVDPENIQSILDEIIKSQSPKQKEIRDRARRNHLYEGMLLPEKFEPEHQFHAQILTFRGAA